eukprot:2503665-Lingulodinium_polyedra.AAC.1
MQAHVVQHRSFVDENGWPISECAVRAQERVWFSSTAQNAVRLTSPLSLRFPFTFSCVRLESTTSHAVIVGIGTSASSSLFVSPVVRVIARVPLHLIARVPPPVARVIARVPPAPWGVPGFPAAT